MASGLTENYDFPYPLPTDAVRISSDIQDLAETIDLVLQQQVPQPITTLSTPTFKGVNIVGGDVYVGVGRAVVFEGSVSDNFETTISVNNPTQDRTINFPDSSGTVVLSTSNVIDIDTINVSNANVIGSNITLLSSVTSSPSSNATIKVNRGTDNDVEIRWNEANNIWEYTNDGLVYNEIGSGENDYIQDLNMSIRNSLLFAGM